MLNGLDLFSGGGFASESLAPWVRTIAYCEIDRAKQDILLSRMLRGEIESAPIWDDITSLRGEQLPSIDIVTGGFPCTDVSLAGPRTGLGAARTGLFFHVVRLVKETAPAVVFLENTPGIRKFIPTIRNQIESLGYECRDGFLSASDIGAPHERKRWFLMAYSHRQAIRLQSGRGRRARGKETLQSLGAVENGEASDVGRTGGAGRGPEKRNEQKQPFSLSLLEGNDWDEYASFLLRMDLGRTNRHDAIRTIGDSVPPRQKREAFMRLSGLKPNAPSGGK